MWLCSEVQNTDRKPIKLYHVHTAVLCYKKKNTKIPTPEAVTCTELLSKLRSRLMETPSKDASKVLSIGMECKIHSVVFLLIYDLVC